MEAIPQSRPPKAQENRTQVRPSKTVRIIQIKMEVGNKVLISIKYGAS